ncbi:MAG: hypothetical protein ACT4P5_13315 [Armatimonadota bacterium]
MISHFAWPGGLAIVVEAPARRFAAVFGQHGWRGGDPREVFPEGPPRTAEVATLTLPSWFIDQVPSLEFTLCGIHTDFVRVNRLLDRLQTEQVDAAILVLGVTAAAIVLSGGHTTVVEPSAAWGTPADAVIARAAGWIVVLSGKVAVPVRAELFQRPARDGSAAMVGPSRVDTSQSVSAGPRVEAARVQGEERFVTAPGASQALPDEVVAVVRSAAGEAGLSVLELLDGARTLTEIAQTTGLRTEQVALVVKTLVTYKLAFRYVTRVRPATGARAPR